MRKLILIATCFLQDGSDRLVDPLNLIDAVMPESIILAKYKKVKDEKSVPSNSCPTQKNSVGKMSPTTSIATVTSNTLTNHTANNDSSHMTASATAAGRPNNKTGSSPAAHIVNGGPEVVIIGNRVGELL